LVLVLDNDSVADLGNDYYFMV